MDTKVKEIVIKAHEIFMKFGIRSVSMDDVCRDIGISKKTLYQYFSNKQELIASMIDHSFSEFESTVSEIQAKDMDAIDNLLELSKIINDHIKSSNPSVTFDLQKYYPDIYKQSVERKHRFAFQYIQENLKKGIREGIYREEINIDLIATLYIQKLEDLHNPGFHAEKISFNDIFKVMFENHIRGISNKKGIKLFEKRKAIIA